MWSKWDQNWNWNVPGFDWLAHVLCTLTRLIWLISHLKGNWFQTSGVSARGPVNSGTAPGSVPARTLMSRGRRLRHQFATGKPRGVHQQTSQPVKRQISQIQMKVGARTQIVGWAHSRALVLSDTHRDIQQTSQVAIPTSGSSWIWMIWQSAFPALRSLPHHAITLTGFLRAVAMWKGSLCWECHSHHLAAQCDVSSVFHLLTFSPGPKPGLPEEEQTNFQLGVFVQSCFWLAPFLRIFVQQSQLASHDDESNNLLQSQHCNDHFSPQVILIMISNDSEPSSWLGLQLCLLLEAEIPVFDSVPALASVFSNTNRVCNSVVPHFFLEKIKPNQYGGILTFGEPNVLETLVRSSWGSCIESWNRWEWWTPAGLVLCNTVINFSPFSKGAVLAAQNRLIFFFLPQIVSNKNTNWFQSDRQNNKENFSKLRF